ncbi:hypothetical protein [uncultured Clostridium sp.]|nr:hypothetical protein [uncultured Clostridium sp.]
MQLISVALDIVIYHINKYLISKGVSKSQIKIPRVINNKKEILKILKEY